MTAEDIEECKNEIARRNNFDSFKRAIRYTFNRELLQSEEEFLGKIINESMQLYAKQHTLSIIERAGRIVVNKYPIDTTVNPRVVKMDIIDAVKQELGLK